LGFGFEDQTDWVGYSRTIKTSGTKKGNQTPMSGLTGRGKSVGRPQKKTGSKVNRKTQFQAPKREGVRTKGTKNRRCEKSLWIAEGLGRQATLRAEKISI